MKRFLLAAALAAGLPAQAGVVYNWVTVQNSPTIPVPAGRIVIADDVWRASRDFDYEREFVISISEYPDVIDDAARDPGSPVESFRFSIGRGETPIDVNVHLGSGWKESISRTVIFDDIDPDDDELEGDLIQMSDGLSLVRFRPFDGDDLWRLSIWVTDERLGGHEFNCGGGGEGDAGICEGAIGRFVLDESTIPGEVPLPGSLALMVVAGIGLMASRWTTERVGR